MASVALLINYKKYLPDGTGNRNVLLLTAASLALAWGIYKVIVNKRRYELKALGERYKWRIKQEIAEVADSCSQKISEERSNEITSLSFEDLQHKLQTGELSCVEVLWAYQLKAVTENVTLNFIAQPIREAESIARHLDTLEESKRKDFPLFGIPISVKENYKVDGYVVTIGLSKNINYEDCKGTAVLVQTLKDAGAVPFIRTNLSQTMLSFGAHNPLYGQTRNPLDPQRSPGGSSSGEGAAIGAGASILGLGTDIGGSLRVPAAWCRTCAIKPTAERCSISWCNGVIDPDLSPVKGVSGFMSRDVTSLVAAMRVTSSDLQFDLDVCLPRIPFNEDDYNSNKPLTIGYINTDMGLAATESAKQAVTQVVAELLGQGHRVVEWQIPKFNRDPSSMHMLSLFVDGGVRLANTLKNAELSYVTDRIMSVVRLPVWLRPYLAMLPASILPANWTARSLRGTCGVKSAEQWIHLQNDLQRYRQLWIDDWKSKGIDAIILPAVPVPAEFIDEKQGSASGCGAYCYHMNLVNFPAGVVPVGEISEEEEVNDWRCYPHSDGSHRILRQMIRGSAGLPLSVQCVSLPFREEICLRLMNIISKMNITS